jgi:hypothetical protein
MPGSTTFTYLPLLTQRNSALWGGDADEFKPERWLESDRLAQFVANPTMYLPFSAGPRVVRWMPIQAFDAQFVNRSQCLGQNYAYNEVTYFLARLLQQFSSFTLASEHQPEGSLPPPEWKERTGRQAIERIWPSNAFTLYIKVRLTFDLPEVVLTHFREDFGFDPIDESMETSMEEHTIQISIMYGIFSISQGHYSMAQASMINSYYSEFLSENRRRRQSRSSP